MSLAQWCHGVPLQASVNIYCYVIYMEVSQNNYMFFVCDQIMLCVVSASAIDTTI